MHRDTFPRPTSPRPISTVTRLRPEARAPASTTTTVVAAHPSAGARLRAVPSPTCRQRQLDPRQLLDDDMRRLRRHILAESLATGRPLSGDAVTVVLAAKAWRDEPMSLYTESIVREMLWVDIIVWCEAQDLELPLDAPEALWALVQHVTSHHLLHPAGDDLTALRRPLVEAGGLTESGDRRRFPMRRAKQ